MKWVPKIWGGEEWIVNNHLYCGKKLLLKKDHHCSFHYHKDKHETFYVECGRVLILYSYDDALQKSDTDLILGVDEKEIRIKNTEVVGDYSRYILEAGQSLEIPRRLRHLFFGLTNSYIYEFSTHHEDSDSYRLTESS